jgi:hypothetical protein
MPEASAESAGMAFLAFLSAATSAWGVPALTVTLPAATATPEFLRPLRSMMSEGAASPCFMVGNSVMPPDRNFPSFAFFIALTASAGFVGR